MTEPAPNTLSFIRGQGSTALESDIVKPKDGDRISTPEKEAPPLNIFGGTDVIYFTGENGVRRELSVATLQREFLSNPTEGLRAIAEVSSILGSSIWTALRLSIPANVNVRIEVRDSEGKLSPEKEKELRKFCENLDQETGGIVGILNSLFQDCFFAKNKGIECVPSPVDLGGLDSIWPINPSHLRFSRDADTRKLWPYVKTYVKKDGQYVTSWARMPDGRIKWSANDSSSSDPTGKIAFFPAGLEALRDLSITSALASAVDNAAAPTRVIEVDEDKITASAVKILNVRHVERIREYVEARITEARSYFARLKPNENITVGKGSTVKNLEGGDFSGVEPALQYLQQKLVIAAKSLPSLFGIAKSSAANNTEEHVIYAKTIQSKLDECITLLERALKEFFTMKGEDYTVRIYLPLVRTFDELVVANTKQVELSTAVKKIALGWITNEEACFAIEGATPTGVAIEGAVEKVLGISKTDQNNSRTGATKKESGLGN